jgi:hypothetical protein
MTIHKVGNKGGKTIRTGLGSNRSIIVPTGDIIQSPQTSKIRKGLGRNVQAAPSEGGADNFFSLTTIIQNGGSPIATYVNDGVRFNDKTVPSQLTFCAWIKTSLARYQLLLTNATFFATSTSTFPFTTNITATGNLAFGLDASDGDFSYEVSGVTTGLNVADNNWHHIGIMYKGNDYLKFYVDGVQVLDQSIAFSANNPGTLDWCFGIPHQWNSASPSDYGFNGSMAYLVFAPGFVDANIITNAYAIAP